ncbi:DUF4367 domain-containing protein [Thalassobacillus hwangdonensis]|uniref:DUF4367 domain-containing protein n=1 Tax=Thalassobacillus hwangdonensis TaxID=546108 RepID=A0ABW3L5I3_9BACI
MRKYIGAMIMMSILVTGCSGRIPELEEFNPTSLKQEIQHVNFQMQLPHKLPFDVSSFEVYHSPLSLPMIEIVFIGEEENRLSLMIMDAEVASINTDKYEGIKIGNKTGSYIESDDGKTLIWSSEGVSYELQLLDGDHDYSKAHLIAVAESFFP